MSRVYAIEEGTNKRHLIRTECDYVGCDKSIKPHPEIAKSGWTNCGIISTSDSLEWNYCPEHS